MNYAATRLAAVKPSASAAVSQLAKQLKAAGEEVIDLGLGEPDFHTPVHIVEAAFAAALNGPQTEVERVARIPGLSLDPPSGAFYALIGCRALLGASTPVGRVIEDDAALCRHLLSSAKVASVPGSTYGLSPFFRLSTAASVQQLAEAMDRIEACVGELKYP